MPSMNVLFATPTTGTRDLTRLSRAFGTLEGLGFKCVLFSNGDNPDHPSLETALEAGFQLVRISGTGYSVVRNSMINFAKVNDYSHVVFFDDDQVPLAGWGEAILSTLEVTNPKPNVVFGPVISVSDGRSWSTSEDLRNPDILLRTGGLYVGDVYSGNTVIDVEYFHENGLSFDERFNSSGGEDVDIFRRAYKTGGIVAFSPGAVAIEFTPRSRRTVSGRFQAGRTASLRKDTLGRGLRWKAASKSKAAISGILLSLRAALTFDKHAAAEAAFQFGMLRGK